MYSSTFYGYFKYDGPCVSHINEIEKKSHAHLRADEIPIDNNDNYLIVVAYYILQFSYRYPLNVTHVPFQIFMVLHIYTWTVYEYFQDHAYQILH